MFDFIKTYSTKEAAKLLGFRSPSTIRCYAASNKIPGAFKFRKSWRIPHEYILQCLEEEAKRVGHKNIAGRKRGKILNP